MKTLFLSLIALCSISFAGTKEEAYNRICAQMSFDNSKQECIKRIAKFRFFSDEAIQICSSLSFDNSKNACVDAIGNKRYQGYEAKSCGSMSFDNQKVACLSGAGERIRQSACLSNQELLMNLYRIKDLLRRGKSYTAEDQVNELIAISLECSPGSY